MMNKFFIFNDDDFTEVESATLDGMETGSLIESLQGTLIGLHTIQEVTDRVNLVDMGPHTQFKKLEGGVNDKLADGLEAIHSRLVDRLGEAHVERIIAETLFMINLEKSDQDGK
jgi:hypothetical protein